MNHVRKSLLVLLTIVSSISICFAAEKNTNTQLAAYAKIRVSEFDQISGERKQELQKLATYIGKQLAAKQPVDLLFICTHNSRRSHIAQIWAQTAAAYYNVPMVRTFSGGTEVSAFNPNAVAALQRTGFNIKKTTDGSNPIYLVEYSSTAKPMTAFSKKYGDAPNPKQSFAAVMTCANADKTCPYVTGASLRVATHYDDPKASDGTAQESQVYDNCVKQISRELLYAFSLVKR
jgi:protein-tyrosine phosphatase/arsenate reductase